MAAVSGLGCCENSVMSSAYERMWVSGCEGVGMSCMYKLKSVGERTEPWGTPFVKCRVVEGLPLCRV